MVIDIVLQLYEKMAENPSILSYSENEIREIVGDKHSKDDLAVALEFTVTKFNNDDRDNTVRFLSHEEKKFFTSEAYGLLMHLQLTGIIDSKITELLVTRAVISQDGILGVEEVKALVNFVIMNSENFNTRMAIDFITYQDPEGDIN